MSYRFVKFLIFTVVAGAALFLFSTPHASAQATLSVSPESGSYESDSTFTVTIQASSDQQMNAAEASLSFSTDTLSVQSISKDSSVFSLWTEEPTHSNSQGTIRFGGGNPSGFSGNSTLLAITFRTQGEGNAQVSFTDGSVLAADGQGTDILSQMNPGNYQITAAEPPPPPPEPEPEPEPEPSSPTTSLPPRMEIISETHPEQDSWYNERVATLEWEVPDNVTSMRMALTQEEDSTPEDKHDVTSSWTSPELEDGTWYFHARFENSAGLGQAVSYGINIDTAPPEDFEVASVGDEGSARPTLEFESSDELSGIMHYEVSINGEEPETVSPDQLIEGTYRMSTMDMGNYTIAVTAVDKAGNKTSAPEIELEVTEETGAVASEVEEEPGFFEKFGNAIFIFFLVLIIALLITLNVIKKKQFMEMKTAAVKNAAGVRTTSEKVFTALRDEAEDLFASFDGRPGLNDQEKKLFSEMKDALDISEELITREIDCVENKLKE